MIHEAEVFLQADAALLQVVAQIRAEHWDTVIPPLFDMFGADQAVPLRQLIDHLAYDEAWIPDLLAGRTMDEVGQDKYGVDSPGADRLGDEPFRAVSRLSAAATEAARQVTDRGAVVHCSYGDVPIWDYFWQLNVARSVAAHDVALHIGVESPLSAELSRHMYEGTEPAAEVWRTYKIFREPVPVDANAPWRDRFVALTGRKP